MWLYQMCIRDRVKAILQMWYPGQMGGVATANILLGTANPGGKLPVTFPASATAYPQYDPNCNPLLITSNPPVDGNCPLYPGVYKMGFLGLVNHGYKTVDMSANGIFVGYRWYDQHDVKPLFAFGHGLSYTEFNYSKKLVVTPTADGGYDVKVSVRNMGPMDGDEVIQVYLGAGQAPAGVQMAEKALVGFERVSLKKGQTKEVTIHIAQMCIRDRALAGQHDLDAGRQVIQEQAQRRIERVGLGAVVVVDDQRHLASGAVGLGAVQRLSLIHI